MIWNALARRMRSTPRRNAFNRSHSDRIATHLSIITQERAYEAAADALRAEEEREYEREMAERRAAEEAQRAAD